MVNVIASSLVDIVGSSNGYCKTKDYKISICTFPTKLTSLRSKSKEWLAINKDNVSNWSDLSTQGLVSASYHYTNST